MKRFQIYSKIDDYIVLECPHCGRIFRSVFQEKIFGKDRKNTKCQRCEKMFPIEENSLSEDPMFKHWEGKDMIMIKPDGSQIKIEKDKIKDVDFQTASKLQ